jgi:ribosomal protein S14
MHNKKKQMFKVLGLRYTPNREKVSAEIKRKGNSSKQKHVKKYTRYTYGCTKTGAKRVVVRLPAKYFMFRIF